MTASARTAYVAEPPPPYQARPPAVVDCSMLCAVLFDEPERGDAERLMAGRRLLAPGLLDHEIVSVALKKLRSGMAAPAVQRALADYAEQAIELLSTAVQPQCALAARYELSAYDAAYLWLAAELKAPLLTFDRRLGTAAQAHLRSLE